MTKGVIRTDNISVEELRRILSYDPETGICRWRVDRGKKVKAGAVAGTKNALGYYMIGVGGRRYYTHRVAYALMTGEWPQHLVDHIDMNPGNNRWANIRHATKAENMQNRGMQRDNTTGAKGVWLHDDGKYRAEIIAYGVKRRLGSYATVAEASAAYEAAAKVLHGRFARTKA